MTVLGTDAAGSPVHSALWPPRRGTQDRPAGISVPGDFQIEPAGPDGTVHITRDGYDLCVTAYDPAPFLRSHRLGRFVFLAVPDDDFANIQYLLSHRWVLGTTLTGPDITVLPAPDFRLDFGAAQFDLRDHMPRPSAPDLPDAPVRFALPADGEQFIITCLGSARDEIHLRRRPAELQPPATHDLVQWRATPDQELVLSGAEEFLSIPLTVCAEDRAWLFEKPLHGTDHITGRQRFSRSILRESNKFVMMARHTEGVVFDENGHVCSEAGYLENLGHGRKRFLPMPDGMRCDHDRLFVDRDALARAPFLRGPHVAFTPANLENYTHFLVEGILPLHVLRQYAPPGAKILIPATLRALRHNKTRICDHHDMLRVFGDAGIPAVEIADPFVRVEEIYYLKQTNMHHLPAAHMQALRAHAEGLRPAPVRRDRHIYIARRGTRRIRNKEVLDGFLANQNFATYYLEDLSIDQQIDLFSQAAWVIGPHGAEFGNLLFCRPGTKVLELSPDIDFKPFFSYMCNKLGLLHGVLPCPTTTGDFNGDMIIDMRKFTALFRMLKHHF